MADHDLERGAIPQREIEDALAVETTVEGPSRPLQTDGPATDNVDGKAPSGTKIEGTETPGHRRHSDSDERGSNVSSDYPSSQSERSAHSYSRDIFFDEHATNVGSVVPSKNKLVFSPTSRPSSETYFVELANFCLRADNLPSIKISRQSKLWRISDEDYPQIHALYEGTEEQPELLPSHFESLAGFALALRKWESLDKAHMEAEMKEEFALIAEKKTTNREQIERLRKLARYREENRRRYESEYSQPEIDLAGQWYMQKLSSLGVRQGTSREGSENDRRRFKVNFKTTKRGKGQSSERYKVADIRSFPARVTAKFGSWLSIRNLIDKWTENRQFSHVRARNRAEEERHNRHALKKAEMPQRVIAAICGGALLVAPMLIMAIHPSKTKSLVTSSTFVFVFGLGLAFFSASKVSELLAATAAYAAVLVVFVGVSGS